MSATVKCRHCGLVITQDGEVWRDASRVAECGPRTRRHEPDPATLPKPPRAWEPPTPLTVDEHLDRAEDLLRENPDVEDAALALAHAAVAVAMLLHGDR